jgi:SAM-dependent methyltransferase
VIGAPKGAIRPDADMQELSDRIAAHYEKHAREWDADRRAAAWNDRPWHERFAASLRPGASVLDLGCGSGSPIAQYLVECGLRITGVDASPSLISLCRQRLPEQEWIVEDMRSLALARRYDGVLAWDSFFHLKPDDQRRMFAIFSRHAADSAILMFNSGPDYGEAIGAYRGDPIYHASLSSTEYRTLLGAIGFEVVAHAVEDWRTGGGRTVWLARRGAAFDDQA